MTSEVDTSVDATVEELAASADNPLEDVAEAPAESTGTPEAEAPETDAPVEDTTPKPDTADAEALSDADLATVDKYSKYDESERAEKITKMMTSGRKDQVEKAKMLMEAFNLEIEETQPTNTDELVVESLKKLGLTPESIKELQERKELDDRKTAVETWATTLGVNSSAILKNKHFVKAYHSTDGSTQDKVDKAIKVYLSNSKVANAEKKAATLKLSSTSTDKTKPQPKGEVDLEKVLGGKSLDQIDLSKL